MPEYKTRAKEFQAWQKKSRLLTCTQKVYVATLTLEMKKESKLNKHKNKPTTLWNINLEFKFVDLCFEFVFNTSGLRLHYSISDFSETFWYCILSTYFLINIFHHLLTLNIKIKILLLNATTSVKLFTWIKERIVQFIQTDISSRVRRNCIYYIYNSIFL